MSEQWPHAPFSAFLKLNLRPHELGPLEDANLVGMRWYGDGPFFRERKEGAKIRKKSHFQIREGDVIYSKLFAWKGSFGVVPAELDGMFVSDKFPTYSHDPHKIDLDFLKWYFRVPELWEQANASSRGAAAISKHTLNPPQFLKLTAPLPPLAEQRRIVARVDALAARITAARTLRQEVSVEEEALVNATRRAVYDALRSGHTDTSLGDVCLKITDGPHVSPSYVERGVPFISVRNISESGLDFSTAKYVSEADHAVYSKKARVERGDVLYTKGGTTGVARRVDTDREFSIWVHVALLKLDQTRVFDGFIEHMLNAPQCKEQAAAFTRGSSNKDLGLTRMVNIVFPLPPLAEQWRIVAHLDALQAKADALKAVQAESAAELDALLPAVLAAAFAGRL